MKVAGFPLFDYSQFIPRSRIEKGDSIDMWSHLQVASVRTVLTLKLFIIFISPPRIYPIIKATCRLRAPRYFYFQGPPKISINSYWLSFYVCCLVLTNFTQKSCSDFYLPKYNLYCTGFYSLIYICYMIGNFVNLRLLERCIKKAVTTGMSCVK